MLSPAAAIWQVKLTMRDIASRFKYKTYVYGKQHLTTVRKLQTKMHYKHIGFVETFSLTTPAMSGAERPFYCDSHKSCEPIRNYG